MIERLREDLADLDDLTSAHFTPRQILAVGSLRKFVRAVLENREEIEWCEFHGASVVEELNGCGGSDLGEHCDRTPSLRIPLSALRIADLNEEE